MLCALPILALLTGQQPQIDPTKKVTYSCRARDAKTLLKELSELAGITFLTSPVTAKEVVLVHVKDVPIRALIDRLAVATGAEWQKEESGYRLVRPAALQQKQEREEAAERARQVRQLVADLTNEHTKTTLDRARALKTAEGLAWLIARRDRSKVIGLEESRQEAKYVEGSPLGRLFARLLARIPPESIAAIPFEQRVVYSTRPTRMQRAIPGSASSIAIFVDEQNAWSDAAKSVKQRILTDDHFSEALNYDQYLDAPPAKVILSFRHIAQLGVRAQMNVIGADGRQMGRYGHWATSRAAMPGIDQPNLAVSRDVPLSAESAERQQAPTS